MGVVKITVFLLLEICLISVFDAHSLPESELRELDIFLENNEYERISRPKRTDGDPQEEGVDHSGDTTLDERDAAIDIQTESQAVESTNFYNETDTIGTTAENLEPETDGNESNGTSTTDVFGSYTDNNGTSATDDIDSFAETERNETTLDNSETTQEDDSTEPPPVETDATQEDTTGITELPSTADTDTNSTDSTAETNPAESPEPITGSEQAETTAPQETETTASIIPSDDTDNAETPPPIVEEGNATDTAGTPPPIVGSRSAIGRDDIFDLEANQNYPSIFQNTSDFEANATVNQSPSVIIQNITSTNTSVNATQDVSVNSTLPVNSTGVLNTTDIGTPMINSTNVNNTKTDSIGKPLLNSGTTNKTDNVKSNTPNAGESDQKQKASVSGSGVLFTIIILVVIAGLAAIGYVIYKRRQGGYDPVNLEDQDQDKEMIEIKTGNGFGKPISQNEIKLEDQLTPTQPMAAPRSFAVTPTLERKLEDIEVIDMDEEAREKAEPHDEIRKSEK